MTAAGAVGIGVGTGLAFSAKSTFDQSNENGHCNANGCDPTGLGLRSAAVNRGDIATAVWIPGAVVAAAGIVVWVTAPSSKRTTGSSPAPEVGLGPGSVTLRGRF